MNGQTKYQRIFEITDRKISEEQIVQDLYFTSFIK